MKKIITLALASFALNAQAQMVGTDVFLRGQYVEIGIGHLGYYGSDAAAPSGYHPHCTGCTPSNGIGFVADPLMTGWSTSSGSHYMGDYFLPGMPFEGWDLQITSDAVRCQGYNTGAAGSTFITSGGGPYTGSNLSYTASGSTVSGTWQGIADSITITQVTSLDTMAMYFTTDVTFTNLSVFPKNDLYYFRSLDPDNDETWSGGGFPTVNTVDHQMPDTLVEVTGTGLSSTSPRLSLASPDTGARVVIYHSWPITVSQDLGQVYAENTSICGISYYAAGTSITNDIAIGLISHIPHLATVDSAADSVLRTTSTAMRHPANSVTIHFFYAFSQAGVDSAMAHYNTTHSGAGPLAIQNVNREADLKVYPNPARNYVTISGMNVGDRVMVYDMMGRVVIENQTTNRVSLGALAAGGYILSVTDANGNLLSRVPVQKQ